MIKLEKINHQDIYISLEVQELEEKISEKPASALVFLHKYFWEHPWKIINICICDVKGCDYSMYAAELSRSHKYVIWLNFFLFFLKAKR